MRYEVRPVTEMDGEPISDWDRNRYEVFDTETGESLGMDGCEPEDASFHRNFSWVVEELNRLDQEIKDLKTGEQYCKDNH